MLRAAIVLLGFMLIGVALVDGFYTVVVPRRVHRMFRLTRVFYRGAWWLFVAIGRRIRNGARREEILSIFGPLSLLSLLACWALALIVGFALLQWPLRPPMRLADFGEAVFVSASALFTFSLETQGSALSRWIATVEAGTGFAFLGLVVGYLPVLYQSYSSREVRINLLDAHAGSPPTAGGLLMRRSQNPEKLEKQLADWEEWMAELLEEHLSYPMLAYFRSQHQNQAWLSAVTAMLDASALVALTSDGDLSRQARVTFAIGRHTLVDLATVFQAVPRRPANDRLLPDALAELCRRVESSRSSLRMDRLPAERLSSLREMYEPYAYPLSEYFLIALPQWLPERTHDDNWREAGENTVEQFSVSDPFRE